jgi:hypothetical protein
MGEFNQPARSLSRGQARVTVVPSMTGRFLWWIVSSTKRRYWNPAVLKSADVTAFVGLSILVDRG